ncbi:uncharacterized protein EV420DRAFT_1762506 [Desarmillaria tabescens]|uniref:FK506-binding protein n=1 Tax=Armillaria tabescens TaxID=1929756 RepID=A0AA39T376_ARMTA|nr:uncharacterized protein EV420DRAFT_1762506 [Desarmillaria tabescens]KAK0461201.1 hypothetical protein EV420DRAFT_1762506 [Desarmillaria tabescens]
MAITLALWSIKLTPGKPEIIEAHSDRTVTNIAIGDDSEAPSKSSRSTVKLTYPNLAYDEDDDDDSEENITTVLCSLSVGKVEQVVTDIVLNEGSSYKFETTGENTIYVSGHIIDQRPFDSDSDSSIGDEEEAFDLRDVSSDVEIEPEEYESDASRFEEVHDDATEKSLKRPRQSTDMDIDSSKLSKAEKKKAKKQKGEDGKPVVVEADAPADKSDKPSKKDKKEKSETTGKTLAEKELPGGLKIKDSKVGTGPQAKKGNTVQMRYIGKLTNGKVFDSNTKGKPFSFRLGAGEVIKGMFLYVVRVQCLNSRTGWDQGLVGMQAGGERVLTIPPALGYGKKGVSGIPGNATLIFECKLVNIK